MLNQDEKDAITAARNLKPEHKKTDRKALSQEEKASMKLNREEMQKLLNPVIEAHQQELTVIKTELAPIYKAAKQNAEKERGADASVKGKKKNPKKENKRFAYRFLLSE